MYSTNEMCAVINQRKESTKPKYPMLTKNTHTHILA